MSQRGYRIDFTVESDDASFSLAMAWEVLEPFILNQESGIETFCPCGDSVMVLNLRGIREHIQKFGPDEVLSRIAEESKSDEDIAIYRIV